MGCGLKKSVVEELIVGYAARTLDAASRADFERHLQACANCRDLAARQCEVWSVLEDGIRWPSRRTSTRSFYAAPSNHTAIGLDALEFRAGVR